MTKAHFIDFRLNEQVKYRDSSIIKVGGIYVVLERKMINGDQWGSLVLKLLIVFCYFHLILSFAD